MIELLSTGSELQRKCAALEAALAGADSWAVAYSGGVDSGFLTWFIQNIPGKNIVAILALSPFTSARERKGAIDLAARLKFRLETVVVNPLDIPSVRKNSSMRCYHCKREIMSLVIGRAGESGCSAIADGSHAGDAGGFRPGRRVLAELGVKSPLASAGLTKPDIRRIAREAGLPMWNKESQSCLATRIPYDAVITPGVLSSIEKAEDLLWDLGCSQVRVRCHDSLARIETGMDSFPILLEEGNRKAVLSRFRELGFRYVSLDIAGYRSGAWDDPEGEPPE